MSSDVGFASFIRALAPHPKVWPDCVAKELALEFYEVADSKNLMAAMVRVSGAAETLKRSDLHFENEVALSQIIKAINYGNGLALAKKIQNDPSEFQSAIREVEQATDSDTSFDIAQEIEAAAIEVIEKIRSNEAVVSIRNYPMLSELLGGFNDSRIGLVVAGSGVGKTTFVLNLILSAIKTMKCLFVNMEMSISDIVTRVVCINNSVNIYELRKNENLVKDKFAQTYSYLMKNNNLFVTDGRALSLQQITSTIYRRAAEGVKFVVVDYDQKIKTDSGDKEWMAVLKAIEALEEVAKATKTHILVLAQGDDDNAPKASKRSIQPCSYVLALFESDGRYFLESTKNRFGRKFKLSIDADMGKLQMREAGEFTGSFDRY